VRRAALPSLVLALVLSACGAVGPSAVTPSTRVTDALPPEVLIFAGVRDLGRVLDDATTLVRASRPIADLAAVAQLAATAVEPSVDVRAPARFALLGPQAGARGWVIVAQTRPDRPPPPADFERRALGQRAVWVARGGAGEVVLTNAPEWVSAHPSVLAAVARVQWSLDAEVRVSGRFARWWVRDTEKPSAARLTSTRCRAGQCDSAGDSAGDSLATLSLMRGAASAVLEQAESVGVGVSLGQEPILVETRVLAAPGSPLEKVTRGAFALSLDRLREVPVGAQAALVTDLSGPEWAPARDAAAALFGSRAPAQAGAPAWAAFGRSLLGRVSLALLATPGEGEPTLLMTHRLENEADALHLFEALGEGALPPVERRLGAHDVRRMVGADGAGVTEMVHADTRAYIAMGGWASGVLDAVLGGYWTDAGSSARVRQAFEARPAGTFAFGYLDLPSIIGDALDVAQPMLEAAPAPCVFTVRAESTSGHAGALTLRAAVPRAQVQRALVKDIPLEAPLDL